MKLFIDKNNLHYYYYIYLNIIIFTIGLVPLFGFNLLIGKFNSFLISKIIEELIEFLLNNKEQNILNEQINSIQDNTSVFKKKRAILEKIELFK